MRAVRVTRAAAVLIAIAAAFAALGASAEGFPDMPMGAGGMPPMHAKFGRSRRDRVGRAPGSGFTGSFEEPPGFGMGGGGYEPTLPPDGYDGSGMTFDSMNPELLARMAQDGEFSPEDLRAMMPGQEASELSDDPREGEYIGETGWVRTGKFRREGDPEPRRVPEEEREMTPDDLGGQNAGFANFGDDATMDERYTGMPAQPSKKKKSKAVSTGGVTGEVDAEGRPIVEVDTAECFRKAIRVCPMRLMQDNFAAFATCIVENREKMEGSCEGWAETHGECAEDMRTHCANMDPPETTACMVDKKDKLDELCSKSLFFQALEEGFEQMQSRMKAANKVFGAAAAGESAAFQDENGPGMGGDNDDGAEEEGMPGMQPPPAANVQGTAPTGERAPSDEL